MYQFYVDGELLPVTPGKISVKIANQNETLTLIDGEEINLLNLPGLSKISFSCLLPAVVYPFCQYTAGFLPPSHYLSKLETLKNSRKPFLFQVVRPGGDFQSTFTVSLEEYEITEDAEEYGRDIGVNITLLQYRSYGTKVLVFPEEDKQTANVQSGDRDTTGKQEVKTYTVQAGDCLWNIAKKYLGSGTRYTELIQLNLATLDTDAQKYGHASSSNGYWLFPGTVLKIPE